MVLEGTGQELIAECQRGDSEAFRELFEIHKDKVYSVALRYSGDATVAMDITQDVFLKLFSSIQSFRGTSKFESWLYRLVVNSCFDQKRKLRRLMPLVEGLIDSLRAPGVNTLENVLKSEQDSAVQTAIAKLPADQRIVVVLRYTQGLSYDEIADVLNCSPGTVASRLHRIHKVLERRLSHLNAGGNRV